MMSRIATLILFLVFASQSYAEEHGFETGNEMLNQCEKALRLMDDPSSLTFEDRQRATTCIAYTLGTLDMIVTYESAFSNKAICLPDGVTPGQVIRIVVKKLRNMQPELLQGRGHVLFFAILTQTFSCKMR